MDADLEHHAARHALRGVAPRGGVDLAETVAADVRFGVDETSERAFVDPVPYPAEVALAPPLVAEGEHDAGFAAGPADGPAVAHRVGDRLVEKHVLARARRRPGGFQMDVVGRRV